METARYIGDITGNGSASPEPFRVSAPNGLDSDASRILESDPAIEFTEGDNAQAMIIRNGDGHDNIDKFEASRRGVATVNTPGISSKDVALHTLAFILAWKQHIMRGTHEIKRGRWPKRELAPRDPKTLGIIGNGKIGSETASLAGKLFENVITYDADPARRNIHTIEELLEKSDVVCIHASGKETVITKERLDLMRSGTLLVNTSRGKLVDKKALAERLRKNDGFAYAADVFWDEPPPKDDQVFNDIKSNPNFMSTPHIAASRIGNQQNLGKAAVANVLAFAKYGTVNPDNIQGHTLPKISMSPKRDAGGRILLTHESVPGKLNAIFEESAKSALNVQATRNGQGEVFNNAFGARHQLAMTILDLESDVSAEEAFEVMRRIQNSLKSYRARLLWYECAKPNGVTASSASESPVQQAMEKGQAHRHQIQA